MDSKEDSRRKRVQQTSNEREEAMFRMMTDQDIERETAIEAYRESGQQMEDFYIEQVNAGNEPGPDAEDEKMYKRQEGGE
jgi:hypothetical protein